MKLHRLDAASGRIVLQAWIASRGLIAGVALVLAVVQGRSLTTMINNWDVQHFTRLAEGGYLAEPDNILMAFFPGLPALLSIFNHDSAVASAASRMTLAAEGRPCIEMGSRRTHEWSAVAAARAAYVAGFDATSNLQAGATYGVPTTGTAARELYPAQPNEPWQPPPPPTRPTATPGPATG